MRLFRIRILNAGIIFALLLTYGCLLSACGNPVDTTQGSAIQEKALGSASISDDYSLLSTNSDTPTEEQLDELGLNFTDEEIQAAITVAQQYYADWATREIDETMFSPEEAASLREERNWLAQGVEITFDETNAFRAVLGSSEKEMIVQNGAGTSIILDVMIPAGRDGWNQRTITLHRDTVQSDWYVFTEGL